MTPLDEQGALLKRRHLSDLDALRLIAKAQGIAGKVPRRKLNAVLELIDEERAKLLPPAEVEKGGERK